MPAKTTKTTKAKRVSSQSKTKGAPRKTTVGRGGAKVSGGLNWRRALPVIVILAVLGGALAFQTLASQAVPKTTTRTITETIPDKSKSYKTIKASSLNGARSTLTGRKYEAKVHTWSPKEPVIGGGIQTTFGWVGPDSITVCATVVGALNSPVNIEVKNRTTVSSSGPGVTTKATVIGERDGSRVSPTQDVYGSPIPEQNRLAHMRRTEVCTDIITRNNYGSDLTVTVTAQMFEKLEVYGAKTTTKTITEIAPDRSRSYKTVTGLNLTSAGANRLYGTPEVYKPKKDAFNPEGKIVPNPRMRFGWVGPDNITICATVLEQLNRPVTIQVKNHTTISSQGPGVTNTIAVMGQQAGVQVVNPTADPYSNQVPNHLKAIQMRKAEICTDMITRNKYGSDLEIQISGGFEKLEIYGVQMVNGRSNGASTSPLPTPTQYTGDSSGSSSEGSYWGNPDDVEDSTADGTSPDQSGSGSYTTDGGGSEAEGASSTAESGNNNDSGMKSKRWWPF